MPADYDGDGDDDIAVFRNGHWYVQGQPPYPQIWGQAADVPVPADYDGDGDTDIAVFRNGHWYVQGTSLPADLGPGRRRPRPRRLRRKRRCRHRRLQRRALVRPGTAALPADLGWRLRHPAAASLCDS